MRPGGRWLASGQCLSTGMFVHAMKEVFDAQTFHVSALNTAAIAALTADQVSQVWMGQVRALNVT